MGSGQLRLFIYLFGLTLNVHLKSSNDKIVVFFGEGMIHLKTPTMQCFQNISEVWRPIASRTLEL